MIKKSDRDLFLLIEKCIEQKQYVFTNHAKGRQRERAINDLDVLYLLENKPGRNRRRNKDRDSLEPGKQEWNYCIEGNNLDDEDLRIIISFEEDYLLVITVIK